MFFAHHGTFGDITNLSGCAALFLSLYAAGKGSKWWLFVPGALGMLFLLTFFIGYSFAFGR